MTQCIQRVENRQAFFGRLQPLLSCYEFEMVKLAYIVCKEQFRHKVRKGEKGPDGKPLRGFEHPRRVALVLIDEFGCIDYRLIIVAILHDGDEDTRDLKIATIEAWFGKEIAAMVRRLSKLELPNGEKDVGYTDRLIKYGEWEELIVKCCDRLDNLRSLKGCDAAFIAKQVMETKEKYIDLYLLAIRRTPERYKEGAIRLYNACLETLRELDAHLATLAAAETTA